MVGEISESLAYILRTEQGLNGKHAPSWCLLKPNLSSMAKINGNDVQGMVRHWLNTPVGGYLGSDYGQDTKSLLQRPHADGAADSFLAKMRSDVPVLEALPAGSLNLYGVPSAPDRLDLVVEVFGQAIEITGGANANQG